LHGEISLSEPRFARVPAASGHEKPVNVAARESDVHGRIDAEIVRRRRDGDSYRQIADALGISVGTVQWLALKAGIAPTSAGHARMSWPAGMLARGRKLWDEGFPTATIGRQLGVTKSAVIGKAHREGWPARPSPILRGQQESAKAARERTRRARVAASATTIPPLASLAPIAAAPGPPPPVVARPAPPPPQATPPPAAQAYGRVVPCSWCISSAGRPRDFRFCEAASLPGDQFCTEHTRNAHSRAAA
jgi:hypothetical protein